MRYVAAYLLAVLGGKDNPNGADIEKILGSVGIESEKVKLDKVIGELNGKNIEQLIEAGRGKLASMPSGGGIVSAAGGGGGGAGAAPSVGASAPAAAKEEAKKEEAKEEESDEDLGFGLFD